MSSASLSFDAIHAALSRCMDAHPPQGLERSLHPDADVLANKWALLSYLRESELATGDADEVFLTVLTRWSSEASDATMVISDRSVT